MIEYVIKRDGRKEPFDSTKFNKLTKWTTELAINGENEADWSMLALQTVNRLYNGCTTRDILEAMMNVCLDQNEEVYFYIAGKILISNIYKELYPNSIPHSLRDQLEKMGDQEIYLDFLDEYTDEEIEELEDVIDHSKDFLLTHSQINQMRNKYLCTNRVTKKLYETPQFMFMRVAMAVCMYEEDRVEKVKVLYRLLSDFNLNLPTPMWTNLGTPFKTGSSCLVYVSKDSVGSLTTSDHIANIMTVAGAGIGNTMFTRSKKDPIQGGRLEHLGKIPYFRLLQANIDATMQSGARRGAATTYINCLDPEIETLIHLRNPTSIDEERVDGIDYAFSFNSFFMEKVKNNEEWMLISYYHAKDLYEAFYQKDQNIFRELYQSYLESDTPKKIIKARDLALRFLTEQGETGRLYEFNASNANIHTPFKEEIYGSNLCITGDQLVPSNYGLLTAQELYELGESLTLFDGKREVKSSPMKLRETDVPIFKVTLKNGMTHKVTDYHKIMTSNGLMQCKDLTPGVEVKINTSVGIFGTVDMVGEASLIVAFGATFIPRWVREGNRETQKAYAEAILKTDMVFEKSFAEELQVFFNNLGETYSLRPKGDSYELVYDPQEFVEVVSVEYVGKEDVYCPTVDTDEHLFIANGIVTSNCNEIYLSTKPHSSVLELYKDRYDEGDGYVQTCNLAAINLNRDYTDEEYYQVAYWALKIIDYVIDFSEYKLPQIGVTTKKFRSAGVSFINLAYYMAKNKKLYTSKEGKEFIHWLAERHEYMLTKASLQLGKELGNAEWMNKTLYPQGWLPLDTYNRNVDSVVDPVYKYDWEGLRAEIIANGGIRNSVLSTSVPSESCLDYRTKVMTSDGVLSLLDILTGYTDHDLNMVIDKQDKFSGGVWVELNKPLKALTAEGYHNIPRIWYNGSTYPYQIEMEDSSIINCTANHKFLTHDGRWVRASELSEGDDLSGVSPDSEKVKKIKMLDVEIPTFDIEVESVHHYTLENGLITHNSSLLSNSTNSTYPIRQAIVVKTGANSKNVFMAPEYEKYKDWYEIAWDIPTKDITEMYAIIQKFTSQGLSCDYYVDHTKPESKSAKKHMIDWLYRGHLGLKGKYYTNNKTSSGKVEEVGCASGACTL